MSKLIILTEKDPTERVAKLWLIRRWAATQAWNLHVKWRHRAIQAEAAVRHLAEELAREQELRREEAKRADAWKRDAQGKANKLVEARQQLDRERALNAFNALGEVKP